MSEEQSFAERLEYYRIFMRKNIKTCMRLDLSDNPVAAMARNLERWDYLSKQYGEREERKRLRYEKISRNI